MAILLVALLAIAVFLFFLPSGQGGGTAEIYQHGSLVKSCPLSDDARLEISGDYTNIITISGGRAAITESDCPGGDCVHSGWISSAGRSLVCLPNGVEVRITGKNSDVDFAVR